MQRKAIINFTPWLRLNSCGKIDQTIQYVNAEAYRYFSVRIELDFGVERNVGLSCIGWRPASSNCVTVIDEIEMYVSIHEIECRFCECINCGRDTKFDANTEFEVWPDREDIWNRECGHAQHGWGIRIERMSVG